MNKLLIAIAAAAVCSGAFAQAQITGTLAMGYKATKSAKTGSPEASGLGTDTSEIDFKLSEDLGGGQKVAALMSIGGADRSGEGSTGGKVTGRDAKLTYTNNAFGQIELGSTKPSNYFAGIASAGAPVIDFDEKLYQTESASDYISYTAPIGSVYIQVKHGEASADLGLGSGTTASTKQRSTTFSAYYSAGATTLLAAYASYDNRKNGDPNGATVLDYVAGTKDAVINLQGSYDFGVAKIGMGYQMANASNGVTVTDALVGFAAPMGAWTVGATWGMSAADGAKNATAAGWDLSKYNGVATGYSVGASYALSKRTSITGKYAAWTHSGYSQYEADGAKQLGYGGAGLSYDRVATQTSLLLSHSF